MGSLFSLVPSILLLLVWVAGLVLCATHADHGRWRALAIGGFGTLAMSSVVGLTPTIYLMTVGYSSSIGVLFGVIGLVGIIFSLVGAALLIAAVVTGRPRPAPPA